MLKSLGIPAQREFIFAAPESTWENGGANYVSSSHAWAVIGNEAVGSQALFLDFRDVPNEGEGAVRVGSCVYTEGGTALVVGQDGATCLSDDPIVVCSAELDALVQLANLYGGTASFQQMVTFKQDGADIAPSFVQPAQYVALPFTESP
jgi:hypothetical protein